MVSVRRLVPPLATFRTCILLALALVAIGCRSRNAEVAIEPTGIGRPKLTAEDAKIASVAAQVDERQTNLVEGEVAFLRPGGESGGPRRAAISRVWASTGGPGMSESDWLERQYGKKRVLSLKVPGT